MKKYLVIGSPIEHSLSPKIHNYWFKKYKVKAIYEKKKINNNEIKDVILDIRKGKISGINVTVPFKKSIIPFIDELTNLANITQSVNTVYKKGNLIIGDNTDVGGFELGIKKTNYNLENKKVFLLGAGGVAPSIILALEKMKVSKIILSNRTRQKAEELKKKFLNLEILNWGDTPSFDLIVNATSMGLKDEEIDLDYEKIGSNKLFYDVIYNPTKTKFLIKGEKLGNQVENGKMMFLYQAQLAFNIWHNILPLVDEETISLLNI
jgi:shikimate dehydrogenase